MPARYVIDSKGIIARNYTVGPPVINKIDLAPLVGAGLDVMKADTLRMRVHRPFVFTNLKSGEGVEQIAGFVIDKGGLRKSAA